MKLSPVISVLISIGSLRLAAQAIVSAPAQLHAPRLCSLIETKAGHAGRLDDAALLAVYNAQARLVRSLRLTAMVRGNAGQEYRVGEKPHELPASIEFVQPDMVHVTGVVPFVSSRAFEMASDGRELRLLIPENGKKTFFVGAVDSPIPPRNARQNLRPQPLINALHWQQGSLAGGSTIYAADKTPMREIKVDLPGRTGAHSAKVEFDLAHGQVSSVETFDAAGLAIEKANYSDWQEMAVSPTGPSLGCYPRHIEFVQSGQNYDVTLRISRVVLNPEIPHSSFRPMPPRGIDVVRLDEATKSFAH